ncbi:MAG TPA: hypothetical protein VMX94_04805 [Armatimonadota bacterium]|nr:hypothetical protein [Armatimonadota bacterium]
MPSTSPDSGGGGASIPGGICAAAGFGLCAIIPAAAAAKISTSSITIILPCLL